MAEEKVGPPAAIQIDFADDASFVVDSTVSVTATVTDAEGRAVEGDTVRWAPADQVAAEADTTNTQGQVEATWTLASRPAGPNAQTLTATVAGTSPSLTVTRAVNVNPGAVNRLTASLADAAIPVDSTTTVSVADLEDIYGNEITDPSGYTFTWSSLDTTVATVSANAPSTSAAVQGRSDGSTQIVVTTGGAPGATTAGLRKAAGAAADTLTIEVRRHELRGVWLTNVDSDVLNSRSNIEEAMEFLEAHNFNAVFPVVWNQSATMYPSTVMDTLINRPIDPEYAGRDPLQEVIEEAQERGIAVIPWFEYGFASSFSQSGGPIIDKYPSWAARDTSGDLVTKNGFDWMNGYKPAVQNLLMSLVMEVVNNYDVDGVQGDDRLPANPVEGGYSEYTKQLYRSEHSGQNPPDNENNAEWKQWRADKLSDFGQRIYDNVKAEDDDLIVSWSPSPFPFGYNEYLQDYPAWINRGFTDIVHPQLYRRDVGAYRALLDQQLGLNWDPNEIVGFYPGVLLKVGGYVATPEDMVAVVEANRERGVNGEVFFFYEGLREFDADVATALRNGPYSDPAPLPFKRASRSRTP
jgi:uncharacterized lipoprotein YddW (UPF0748 family)